MAEYWRDLNLGEEIKVGDRCFGADETWFTIQDLNLEYQRHVTEYSRPIQRKADCVPPAENGKNRYGVDVSYFRNAINRELNRGLIDYRPDELARVLARLSVTADSSVIFEGEFQARKEL
ncbi:hypothetical protein [Neptuniibacter pectenicola]|uniref:hypothetical protein n=1 Tax=Neptuniibacter pectenicola TaxID=1806669 RepID=UPI00082CCA41|nr:hypothetical protein [Neptuniibacter pectenicola]